MSLFTVSVIMNELELTDDVIDVLFRSLPASVPSSMNGVVKITCPVEASDAEAAAFQLIEELHDMFPSAVPVRLDQDLVSIPDIAERTDRSRESVRLLVDGRRGPGGFPAPVGIVGDSIRVWPWAAVLGWFAAEMGESLGEVGVAPAVAAVVDACLAGNRFAEQDAPSARRRAPTAKKTAAKRRST